MVVLYPLQRDHQVVVLFRVVRQVGVLFRVVRLVVVLCHQDFPWQTMDRLVVVVDVDLLQQHRLHLLHLLVVVHVHLVPFHVLAEEHVHHELVVVHVHVLVGVHVHVLVVVLKKKKAFKLKNVFL